MIPIVWLIGIPIAIIIRHKKKEAAEEAEPKKGYILDGYEVPEGYAGDGLCAILLSAFRSLEKQHAGRYRNWLSSCIDRLQKGLDVPPEIALRALYMTRDELSGPRFEKEGYPTIFFNLDGLNEAIVTLEEQMGEWE